MRPKWMCPMWGTPNDLWNRRRRQCGSDWDEEAKWKDHFRRVHTGLSDVHAVAAEEIWKGGASGNANTNDKRRAGYEEAVTAASNAERSGKSFEKSRSNLTRRREKQQELKHRVSGSTARSERSRGQQMRWARGD